MCNLVEREGNRNVCGNADEMTCNCVRHSDFEIDRYVCDARLRFYRNVGSVGV